MSNLQSEIDKIKKNYLKKKHIFKIGDIVDIYGIEFKWERGYHITRYIGYGTIYDIEPQYERLPITIDNICYLNVSIYEIEDSLQVDDYQIYPIKNRKKDYNEYVEKLEKDLYGD